MVFRRPLSVCDIQVCAIVFLSVIDCAAMDVLDGVSNDVLVFTTVCGAITAGVLVWQHHQPSSNLDRPVSASGPSNQTTAPQIQVTVRLNSASQGDLSLSLPADTSISDLKMECLSRMDLPTSDKEIRIIRSVVCIAVVWFEPEGCDNCSITGSKAVGT